MRWRSLRRRVERLEEARPPEREEDRADILSRLTVAERLELRGIVDAAFDRRGVFRLHCSRPSSDRSCMCRSPRAAPFDPAWLTDAERGQAEAMFAAAEKRTPAEVERLEAEARRRTGERGCRKVTASETTS